MCNAVKPHISKKFSKKPLSTRGGTSSNLLDVTEAPYMYITTEMERMIHPVKLTFEIIHIADKFPQDVCI